MARAEAVSSTSDELRVAKSADPVTIGAGISATRGSKTLTLPADLIRTIDNCESGWTPANSASVSHVTATPSPKEGTYSVKIIAPASPATNTLYAYKATILGAIRSGDTRNVVEVVPVLEC
jgi:hypothetical protein